jgi:hypothetical protein
MIGCNFLRAGTDTCKVGVRHQVAQVMKNRLQGTFVSKIPRAEVSKKGDSFSSAYSSRSHFTSQSHFTPVVIISEQPRSNEGVLSRG